jgi:hypothetical protein
MTAATPNPRAPAIDPLLNEYARRYVTELRAECPAASDEELMACFARHIEGTNRKYHDDTIRRLELSGLSIDRCRQLCVPRKGGPVPEPDKADRAELALAVYRMHGSRNGNQRVMDHEIAEVLRGDATPGSLKLVRRLAAEGKPPNTPLTRKQAAAQRAKPRPFTTRRDPALIAPRRRAPLPAKSVLEAIRSDPRYANDPALAAEARDASGSRSG